MSNPGNDNKKSATPNALVTCPHCWSDFPPKAALFIATHPELIGDKVLGEHHYKRFALADIKVKKGRPFDVKGFPITDRACPNCRLQIPSNMLKKSPIFISLAGAPSVGKTYFITSLIHTLRNQLPQKFNLILEYATSDEIDRIEKVVDKLFCSPPDKPVYLEKTQESGGSVNNLIKTGGQSVELPKPFLFTIRPMQNHTAHNRSPNNLNQTLALYDCSGEHFQYGRHRNTSNRSFGHFAKAKAILFIYDPLQDAPAQDRLSSISKDPQVHNQKHTSQQSKTLEAVIHQVRILRQMSIEKRIKSPLIVVVQKYDVWSNLLPDWAKLGATSIENIVSKGVNGINIEQLNCSSLQIRKFLSDASPMFVAQAEANFETVRYFAVSAIGTSPSETKIDIGDEYEEKMETRLCVLPQEIHPFRVTDPFLWLLAKWQLINTAKLIDGQRKDVPEATVVERSEASIKILLPDSGSLIVLDKQYFGSLINDPSTGSKLIVPNQIQLKLGFWEKVKNYILRILRS